MPSQVAIASGLLAVARRSGYRIEDLLTMRVEGFYLLIETLRADAERTQAEANGEEPGVLPGVEYESKVPQSLVDLMERAEGVPNGD